MIKTRKICGSCSSSNINIDAWAEWNEETQEMELSQTFDDAFCEDCEETGNYSEEVISDNPPKPSEDA